MEKTGKNELVKAATISVLKKTIANPTEKRLSAVMAIAIWLDFGF
ncbi:MAG: hypothetical protein ACE5OZ_00395 [Candidatus Heimdallarchaeota archaeon]